MPSPKTLGALVVADDVYDHLKGVTRRPYRPSLTDEQRARGNAKQRAKVKRRIIELRYDRDVPVGRCALVDHHGQCAGPCPSEAPQRGRWIGICDSHQRFLRREKVDPGDIIVVPRSRR